MTGSEMAKAGLLEQNRLSGANRNTLIAGGIMANTAEIFNFPVPDAVQKEPRVADLDDGYTRIANELLEAVMLAGLTQHQLLVLPTVPVTRSMPLTLRSGARVLMMLMGREYRHGDTHLIRR